MRLLFFGSPDFAVPALRALHEAGHDIAVVVTRPDRPRGRGRTPEVTAVKAAALELGLPVYQPERAGSAEAVEKLRALSAELAVVVAFGEILSPELLSVTERGFLNVHASLLPDYRGAAPINWAIIRGEKTTGVSVIRMTPQLDAGPILAERRTEIGELETAGELAERLSLLGAAAVADVVGRLEKGEEIAGRPQPSRGGFFARKLTKEDGRIDWALPAEAIANRVRGLTPWPGAYCELHGARRSVRVVLLEAVPAGATERWDVAGTILEADAAKGILVKAGQGALLIKRIKPSGGRTMNAADFINGYRVRKGDRFT